MTITLYTPTPRFAADLMDVVRVFYGAADCVLTDKQSAALVHRFSDANGTWACAFTYQGRSKSHEMPIPPGGEIEKKRSLKRLLKQVLYGLLKDLTGIHPPWGSLTGIRPTRLFYAQLDEGMTFDQAQKALESVFDVTPEKAALLKQIVAQQQKLPLPDSRMADVYIGIPFCVSLCAYCSFASGELGGGKQVGPYLEALKKDMAATAQLMKDAGLTLRALYVGGGTPTALGEADFEWLLDQMALCFPSAMEVTVEAGRPDTVTPAKLSALKGHGVDRISINPQTMNDQTLKVIGRSHTAADVSRAYAWAREAGLQNINMDLIAGLPGEGPRDFENTLAAAQVLAPESLTLHTLAIKRSSRMHLQAHPLPDGSATAEMLRLGAQTAKAMHMLPYYLYRQKYMAGNQENVGYALEGLACLYNVDMMEETTHIFGVGAGAMSKRVFDAESRIERAPNVSDIAAYISRVDEMAARKRKLWNRE